MRPANGIGAKRNAPPRLWDDAIAKKEREAECRNPDCAGKGHTLEFHHLSGRENDPVLPCPRCSDGFVDDDYTAERVPCEACQSTGLVRYVRPESGIPLCGPVTTTGTCHNLAEGHELDCLPFLTNEEAACAVLDLGLERAYRNLSGEGRSPSPLERQRLREAA